MINLVSVSTRSSIVENVERDEMDEGEGYTSFAARVIM